MGSYWVKVPPHDMPEPQRCADDVEADIRKEMARHAAIAPRGFDSIRERTFLHQKIDRYLDEYALFVAVESMVGGL